MYLKKWTARNGTERPDTESPGIEVVTVNPLQERYDRDYHGVKIKNETDFDLTDDILNPEGLNINKNNILIFHTHTCESYTQSETYTYEETRYI